MKKIIILLFAMSITSVGAQTISTVAGTGVAGFSGDGGQASVAQLNTANGTCFDAAGNMYIADIVNQRVRKVTPAGIITTVAGNGSIGYSGDGNLATSATLNRPVDVAVDPAGNLYIADELNFVVRKVSTSGIITTFAGTHSTGYTGDGGLATSAQLSRVNAITWHNGCLYITTYQDNVIRKVDAAGFISTVAGNGIQGFSGDGGLATSASFYEPCKTAFDGAGNMYIADEYNQRIRKVNTAGIITTFAGNGTAGYSGDGGSATSAMINYVESVWADAGGTVYIGEKLNQRIRMINSAGIISTIGGTGTGGYSGDGGPATSAMIKTPQYISFDAAGNLYFGDTGNSAIRKITNVVAVGVQQVNTVTELAYPNPTEGLFIISNPKNAKMLYQLINSLGETVMSGVSNGELHLENLPAGMYYLNYELAGEKHTLKVSRQ